MGSFKNKIACFKKNIVTCAKIKIKIMKKVVIEKPIDTNVYLVDLKPNQHIGFVDNYGYKGYLVYVGKGCAEEGKGKAHLHAVRADFQSNNETPNMSYGPLHLNQHHTPQKALILGGKKAPYYAAEVYVFEDRKELYLWLSL